MKIPVVSKGRKILLIVVMMILWFCAIMLVYLCVDLSKNSAPSYYNGVIVEAALAAIATVCATIFICISLASYVVIDENGIALQRCAKQVNYFLWEEVCRVEVFEAVARRSLFMRTKCITVANIDEPSWGYRFRTAPTNFGKHYIGFVYDDDAFALIEQHCKDKIYS